MADHGLLKEVYPLVRVRCDGSQMEELWAAAELSQQVALRRRVLSLCSLIPFPMHGPAKQSTIQDLAWVTALGALAGTHY